MNILILCTYYPPDTAVAAVRPYMLAKYLTKFGHNVTVIRSGAFYNKPDNSFEDEGLDIKVYSYLGENNDVERFLRGEFEAGPIDKREKMEFLPKAFRAYLRKIYYYLIFPCVLYKYFQLTNQKYELYKKCIDCLDTQNFDVVFATYSDLENVYAGAYAAEKFGCKYILDFRDLIALKGIQKLIEYITKSHIQKREVLKADICTTVSEGLSNSIKKRVPNKKVITLHNGYEKVEDLPIASCIEKKLCFCYTGALYQGMRDATPIFKILKQLSDSGKIDIKNIVFDYAGSEFEEILAQAKKFDMCNILVNHGHVDKSEAARIQMNADIFVVLSWNTKYNKGILTGKFYESLKNKKPVVACISGDEPQSELRNIITEYNLGVCFEEADGEATEQILHDYIVEQYNRKLKGGKVVYEPEFEVFDKFEYSGIAKQLETIMKELIY